MLPITKTPPKSNLSDYTVLMYGATKMGKSTFAAQAPDALFLATEPGLNALEVYQQPITSWVDLLAACAELSKGEHSFKTVVIDTIDNAYRMCAEHVCGRNGVDHEADLPYGKGFSLVQNEFQRVLTKLAFMPCGLILISHAQEREIETPGAVGHGSCRRCPRSRGASWSAWSTSCSTWISTGRVPARGGSSGRSRRRATTQGIARGDCPR